MSIRLMLFCPKLMRLSLLFQSLIPNRARDKLKIKAQPSFGAFHLSRALSGYMKKYPEVSTELELSNRMPDLVEDGVDLAFHVGKLDDSTFVAHQVASSRRVVCASPDYLNQHDSPVSPSELQYHNCLIYSPRSSLMEWDFIDEKVKVTGNIQCNDGDAPRVAAIRGCGIAQLPTYIVGMDIQSGRLCALLQDFEPEKLPVFAIYNNRKYLAAKIKTFVEYIYELYQPEAYWNEWT